MGSAFRDGISGGVGAVFCTYAGIPFDTVKVRMQTVPVGTTATATFGSKSGSSVAAITARRASGSTGCALAMARQEGARAFFRGATPALASALVENTVLFGVHGVLGRWLHTPHHHHHIKHSEDDRGGGSASVAREGREGTNGAWGGEWLVSSSLVQHGLAGACSSTAICPAEVIKVRLQHSVEPMTRDAALRAVGTLWREEGLRGFSRGLPALWARDIPFYMVFFGVYEAALSRAERTLGVAAAPAPSAGDSSPALAFVCGGLAGSTAWAAVFPCDVVKSRQQIAVRRQLQPGSGVMATPPQITRLGFMATARAVLAESGPAGLYRGVGPACLRGFPANGALFVGVQSCNRLWHWMDGGVSPT
jgi:hypothetical protein